MATQVDRVMKTAYILLLFISWGITYESQEVMLQPYKTLIWMYYGVLYPVLVSPLQLGYAGFAECAEGLSGLESVN